MSKRETIINYIISMFEKDVEFSTVTRIVKPFDMISITEMPQLCIIDGEEIRNYQGKIINCIFSVNLRIIDDKERLYKTKKELNYLIEHVVNKLEADPLLGGTCSLPLEIVRIDTDEGWLYPFTFANIVCNTNYRDTRCNL